MNKQSNNTVDALATSIAPWLTVADGRRAIQFYADAFSAVEAYRLEDSGGGVVARLSVNGAEFWLSGEAMTASDQNLSKEKTSGIRMILTTPDPDVVFEQAIKAGAMQIFPVSEDHGWRIGRLQDPFGYQWEIGCPVSISQNL